MNKKRTDSKIKLKVTKHKLKIVKCYSVKFNDMKLKVVSLILSLIITEKMSDTMTLLNLITFIIMFKISFEF